MNNNNEVREMYLAVNLKRNTIWLRQWQRIGGERVRVSCKQEAYDENGRVAEVLRRSRERGLLLEEVITRLVGRENMDKVFKKSQLQT